MCFLVKKSIDETKKSYLYGVVSNRNFTNEMLKLL